MKKNRKNANRLLSMAMALTMIPTMTPDLGVLTHAEVKEELVESLAKAYDGDEARALTANGVAVTRERILLLQEAQCSLELIRMMSQDVEITYEHVENFKKLVAGIADGSTDLETAAANGSIKVDESAQTITRNNYGAPYDDSYYDPYDPYNQNQDNPEDSENMEVDADVYGVYKAPYIKGSEYEEDHSFQLADPANKVYYRDETGGAVATDGVVTLTFESYDDTMRIWSGSGSLKVTATLNKKQDVPVSFDWKAATGWMESSNTVTWEPGEEGEKSFWVSFSPEEPEYWDGYRSVPIVLSNLQNALFENGRNSTTMMMKAKWETETAREEISASYPSFTPFLTWSKANGDFTYENSYAFHELIQKNSGKRAVPRTIFQNHHQFCIQYA